jgi:hypothetical protein
VGKYFYFLQIYFFGEKKKRAMTFWMMYVGFGEKISKNGCIYDLLSEKKSNLKNNHLKQCTGSEVICILKSLIFKVFFVDVRVSFMIYVDAGDEFFKKNPYLNSSHNFTQFQKKNRPNRSSVSEDIFDLKSTMFFGFFVTTIGLQSS